MTLGQSQALISDRRCETINKTLLARTATTTRVLPPHVPHSQTRTERWQDFRDEMRSDRRCVTINQTLLARTATTTRKHGRSAGKTSEHGERISDRRFVTINQTLLAMTVAAD